MTNIDGVLHEDNETRQFGETNEKVGPLNDHQTKKVLTSVRRDVKG